MHLFFQQNPFKADAESDLENDARLALHLVLYLLFTQDPDDGTWRGIDINATLRHTCHSLEALHLLGWELSAEATETGIAWLVNLPDVYSLPSEEEDSLRLYPSRFKTLAWLGEFNDPQVKKDFETLEEHLDEEGQLRGIMANQFLGTMVYVDCLDYLEKLGPLPVLSAERRTHALNHIQNEVRRWHQELKQNSDHTYITSTGDLSYAVDLLIRANMLPEPDEISHDGLVTALISALEPPERSRPMPSDTLYCAIQLITHFSHLVEAREVVRTLIHHLRSKYEQLDLKKETTFFHPLVLRVLLTYYGDQLKTEMTRLLLERERQHLELRRQSVEENLKDDFRSLIKNRFTVEISDIQPLTGGFTKAEVFRTHFLLKFTSISQGDEVQLNTYQPSPGSLVIKSGSLESLRRSIQRYRSLPEGLKPYFALHTGEAQILKADPTGPCYMIMEDLTYMNTFQDIIARIDQGRLSQTQTKNLEKASATICASLFDIYDQTLRDDTDFFGSQLSRLYMSSMEKHLIRMCHPDKFPHLKSWLRGFWLGERKYRSIEYYLRKLESHKAKLKIPYLMLTHGDSHSRNIMLDAQLHQLKLIDLDHLDHDGDYIKDLALLIEDVCVFRFLFDEGYRFYLGNGSTRFVSYTTEPKLIENRIEYPPFSSDAGKLFQQHLLRHLKAYAHKINDTTWKNRLWLALATYLMFLVTKQTERGYATVVYVEAVKLLDELVTALDKRVPLNKLPFPGQHPAGVDPESSEETLTLPAWYRADGSLAQVHDGLMALSPTIKCELTASGRVAQYFATNPQQPFAVINGKKQPATILLACSPDDLSNSVDLAQARKTSSAFQTIVEMVEEQDLGPVLKVIKQAFDLNR